jgi:hypothetical protein
MTSEKRACEEALECDSGMRSREEGLIRHRMAATIRAVPLAAVDQG